MLITTRISNEKPNALIIHGILCRNVTIFYRQELTSLFQVQKKLHGGGGGSLKLNFLSFLIADDSHVQIVWVHVGVFCDHDILHFCPFV